MIDRRQPRDENRDWRRFLAKVHSIADVSEVLKREHPRLAETGPPPRFELDHLIDDTILGIFTERGLSSDHEPNALGWRLRI